MSDRILLVVLYRVGSSTPIFYSTKELVAEDTGAYSGKWGGALDKLYIEGRVIQPGLIERTMYGAGRLRGGASVAAGAIVLSNADGGLDDVLTYSFDGKMFELWLINPATNALSEPLRMGYIEQPIYDENTITFHVKDSLHALDVNLLTTKYAGTNALPAGIEGTPDDIGGTPKPVLLGTCKNITPVQVNTSKKIYQIDGVRGLKTGYTLDVYDKRALVTEDGAGDYANQAAMENDANIPAAGQYRVWPAGGCIRINFTPTGALTCDVTNPADKRTGGVAALTDVLYTLNGEVLGLRSPDQSTGFLPAGQLYDNDPDVGIYLQDDRTALAVVQELLGSAGGFIVSDTALDGTYSGNSLNAAQLYEPGSPFFTPDMSTIEITEDQVLVGTYPSLVPPGEPDRGLPVWRVNVKYARNWTVMSETELAGIAAADVAYYTQEYRIASASDAAIKTDWPNALELTVTTQIVGEADAQAEADRLLDLFGVVRQRLTLRLPSAVIRDAAEIGGWLALRFGPGARITLEIPRFGLDGGKTFVVLEKRENFEDDTVDLVVWG